MKAFRTPSYSDEHEIAEPTLVAMVDDDESVRVALGSLFRSMGFRTELFGSAEEFLSAPNLSEFECLVLDVLMPGMSGFELQERLVGSAFEIPIIFISALGDKDARDRAMRAGAVGFLSKPFSDDALIDAVQVAIAREHP
jgi:FixJ family two-component response regulator